MRYLLIGRGKMGRLIQETARTAGDEIQAVFGREDLDQLGKLGRYVETLLRDIAREVRQGNIDADPWGRSEQDSACTYCEFASACHFRDGAEDGEMELIRPVTPAEFWAHVELTIKEGKA